MKEKLTAVLFVLLSVSCQKSLEERACEEARDFTQRECPREISPGIMQDSMTFDASSRSLQYHYTLQGPLDDKSYHAGRTAEYKRQLRQGILTIPALKKYADAGFKFRYIYMSHTTGNTLLDLTVSASE